MKTIRDYIESVFLNLPVTEHTKKLKEDLLAGAQDRYDDLKNQGKSEHEIIGAVISEFGNIDELVEEVSGNENNNEQEVPEINEIKLAEAKQFLALARKGARNIGIGVMIILFGASMIFWSQLLWRAKGEVIGISFVLIAAAIGIPFFIISGLNLSAIKKQLDDRLISIEVKNSVQEAKEQFRHSFILCLVLGVSLCILSVVPLVILNVLSSSIIYQENLGLGVLLIIVGIGIFFLIFGGVTMGSFNSLLQNDYFIADEDELGPKAKASKYKNTAPLFLIIEKIYWPVVVLLYLTNSFLTHNWGSSWFIFPVAGILYAILETIFRK